ncbi:MAG: UDP-N-acetylmuramoyl-L-alanyl-D-glutamate--2,6-diaminopimelate ligase [Candidatus Promineifilaceae bacterium]|nr:UDP-N-acetylmuramoyl-L-alanyl-D-glutamate--2,6-diaminopimelate ligase [Candidatus Promineifilaceae bacterium]
MATRTIGQLLQAWAAAVAGRDLPQPPSYAGPNVTLTALVEHTDDVGPGACFVARVRTGSDGHPYIGQAVAGGAALVVGQRPQETLTAELGSVPYLQVADSALTEAWLAAAWHGFPANQLLCVGVTGTDGKSTTVNLLYAILSQAGLPVGMLSTIKAALGQREEPLALHVTTPEAPVIQAYLRRMVDAGLSHCVIEATSIGLAQHRVAAVPFDVAVVTNITHEHLDYHGSYEAYFQAKARLFGALNQPLPATPQPATAKAGQARTAILNAADDSHTRLAALPTPQTLSYAVDREADVTASAIRYRADATTFRLHLPGRDPLPVQAALPGPFNLANMLAAAAAAHALGVGPAAIGAGLAAVSGLSGRMEPIDRGQSFQVVVDFAHTPNALTKAIAAARAMTAGRVIVLFGSAGKRDVQKRRLMAEIAAREADLTVLTAEDPRTESLDEILAAMAAGCRSQGAVEGQTFWRVPDRGRAIYFALELADDQDLVLLCGKGHEQSMCFGTVEYPWDDRQAARAALDAMLAGRPMPDLGLPTFEDTA